MLVKNNLPNTRLQTNLSKVKFAQGMFPQKAPLKNGQRKKKGRSETVGTKNRNVEMVKIFFTNGSFHV